MHLSVKSGLIGLSLLAFTAGSPALSAEGKKTTDVYDKLELLGDVLEQIRSTYVEEVDDAELVESAIHGMFQGLDPHSAYLPPRAYEDMSIRNRGSFGGLGIEVTMENGVVKVTSPIDDTPAYRAGMQSGDLITHLDGEPILGLTLQEAVDKMRGEVGSDLVLTVVRPGEDEPFDVTITRAVIRVPSVKYRIEDKVGYIRLAQFNEQTTTGLNKAIANFEEELGDGLQGVVLDLRNNPGGLLSQAISVSDAFLEKGEIVSTRGRHKNEATRHNAEPGDKINGKPLVVLINSGSASASEIVAGALQDHRRAIIMGVKSFGKGSVQTIVPLGADQGAIKLTTARYYTPSGASIQAKGIVPDILVEQAKLEVVKARRMRSEADLRGHLDNPQGGEKAPKPAPDGEESSTANDVAEKDTKTDRPFDYQLSRALDLIRGLSLYSGKQ